MPRRVIVAGLVRDLGRARGFLLRLVPGAPGVIITGSGLGVIILGADLRLGRRIGWRDHRWLGALLAHVASVVVASACDYASRQYGPAGPEITRHVEDGVVPESRSRKKQPFTPPPQKVSARRVGSGRWVVPVMLFCFIVGLAWIVTWYLAGQEIPGLRDIGNWNILIGMGLIAIGFVVSTQWR